MKKRLICLLLSVIMLLSSCLVGCAQKDTDEAISDTNDKASESTITLSMYLMSEKEVSAEQAAAVQEAVNKITKSKFKTQLILHFFTEDKYYEAIEKCYADHAAALADPNSSLNQNKKNDKEENVTEETVLNEYGIPELKYPTAEDFQIDIMYISGYDRVKDYAEKDMLADLGDEIGSASSIINSYVSPQYLKYIESICSSTCAIPTNKPIGNYTYLLVNKELSQKYNYKPEDFKSLVDVNTKNFLQRVQDGSKDYVPLRSFTGELDVINMQYFGVDENGHVSNQFSICGGTKDPSWNYLQQSASPSLMPELMNNIFNDNGFTSQLDTLLEYKEKGYYGSNADAGKDFAVGYIKGGVEVQAQYGDKYDLIVVEKPSLTTENLFEDMMAVSANTVSTSRSMQILTYLYTNADFRNILLYGIENKNFELINSNVKDKSGNDIFYVKRLNEDYMMAPEKTGNVTLAYPLEGQPIYAADFYRQQNYDAKYDLLLGFTHDYNYMGMDAKVNEQVRKNSQAVLKTLLALTSREDLSTQMGGINTYFDISFDEFILNEVKFEEYDDTDTTFMSMYYTWLIDNKIYVEPLEE